MATPKARLNQLYNLADGQPHPKYCTFSGTPPGTFFCKLELPSGVVVDSEPCRRKKDAEQDAARKALEMIGTPFEKNDSSPFAALKSPEEVWMELKLRIETAFSNECVLNYKPLMEHFRAAIVRRGKSHAPVPATVLASLDTKIISMCKSLDNVADGNPARALELVYTAAKGSSVLTCDANMWISRVEPFPAHVKTGLLGETPEVITSKTEQIQFNAVFIPSSFDQKVQAIRIVVESNDYYLDAIARLLGFKDGARVLISRSITKAPSGTRLFWGLSENSPTEPRLVDANIRASTLTSHPVYGNAILAAVGSTWKSEGKLCYDDVSLCCYHRLILGKYPTGSYKLSRGAVLTAEISSTYTSKARWRGATPRAILNEFCHQTHLHTPTFCTYSVKKDADEPSSEQWCTSDAADHPEISGDHNFMCKLTMVVGGTSRCFESERSYRSRNDAIQSACLQAMLYFDGSITHLLTNRGPRKEQSCKEVLTATDDDSFGVSQHLPFEIVTGAEKTGDRPPIGSMVHVDYTARVIRGSIDVIAESHTDFDFELGSGAVVGGLDACVASLCVGQTARLRTRLPPKDLLLATEKFEPCAMTNASGGYLEYTVTLQKFVEAAEARMESAVFSPPLSKQRIDYAIQLIQHSQASSLIDFGCGSGSLLEAVLEQPNKLHRIAGVDISRRSLTRASKSLQTKLSNLPGNNLLESVALYEGSIAEADLKFCDFDIATCIEVVEHMDPEPLSKFEKIVLGVLRPKILLVSTPNIEYNPILHGIVSGKEKKEGQCGESTDEASSARRLRNDDHRFEWTRAEFEYWALVLSWRYDYDVEFSGVGGTHQDPGFASQIAIFTKRDLHGFVLKGAVDSVSYSQVWGWNPT